MQMHEYLVREKYTDEEGNELWEYEEMELMEGLPVANQDTAAINSLTGQPEGTLIFNTDTKKLNLWDGTDWKVLQFV